MPAPGAARRYAQAAFGIAREGGEIAAWRDGLRLLGEVFDVPEAQAFLASPRIPAPEKQRFLEERLAAGSPLVRNLAVLLVRKGRVGQAGAIARAFDEIVDAYQGVVTALVTTAVPLEPAQVTQLRALLQRQVGQELRLEVHVDPGIIGGLVAQVGDKVLDGSSRTRLREMRDRVRANALLEV